MKVHAPQTLERWQTAAGLPALLVRRANQVIGYVAVPFTHKLANSRVSEVRTCADVDEARETPPGEPPTNDADRAWWFGLRSAKDATLDHARESCEQLARELQGIDG